MSQRRAAITALGTHVPERVVTNHDIMKLVDTTDEWIRTRTGIEKRHYVEPGTGTSAIAAKAANEALRRRGIGAEFVETGRHFKVMVIGADVMTSILDFEDRTTCVLFGDGAGAVILEPRE